MQTFESDFPPNFRQEEVEKILSYTTTGKFCQLICTPGGGKATLLKLLTHNPNVLKFHRKSAESSLRFVYLNLSDLPSFDETKVLNFILLALGQKSPTDDAQALAQQLLGTINKMTNSGTSLVFAFDHFDEYQNQLPRSFFNLLKSANSLAKYKFSAIFATRRDLVELVDDQTLKDFYDFFMDNTIYMKIYNSQASEYLFSQIENVFKKNLPQKVREEILAQTGGHAKLTKLATELTLRENLRPVDLLGKPIIRAVLSEIWQSLTASEQQILTQITKKTYNSQENTPQSLIKINLIKPNSDSPQSNMTIQQSNNFEFTIPLFEEFITTELPKQTSEKIAYNTTTKEITRGTTTITDLLSPQEYRLVKFLIENQDKIISRDEVIAAVWPNTQISQAISDEAIDQMVFRLRKKIEDNPNQPEHILTVKGQGFRFNA